MSFKKMTLGGCHVLSRGVLQNANRASFWGLAVAYQKPLSIHIPAKYQHISNPFF